MKLACILEVMVADSETILLESKLCCSLASTYNEGFIECMT